MNNIAQVRSSKQAAALSTVWLMPGMLAVNTAALVALERLGGIPAWLKSAVSLFLSF
jgi:hypothetical protein